MILRLLLFLACALAARACSCTEKNVCQFLNAPVLFVGEVFSGGIDSPLSDAARETTASVRFKVIEMFKGEMPADRHITVDALSFQGLCGPILYYQGERYLLDLPTLANRHTQIMCDRGVNVARIPEQLRHIREYAARGGRPMLSGKALAMSEREEAADSKPLSKAKIVATRDGRSFAALTRADGFYRLTLPDSGPWRVTATLPPYSGGPARTVSLVETDGDGKTDGMPCGAIQDFGFHAGGKVTGKVVDRNGAGIGSGEVALIDNAQPASENQTWFFRTDIEHDGEFEIQKVPLGRYAVVYNPTGPSDRVPFDTARSAAIQVVNNRGTARAGTIRTRQSNLVRPAFRLGRDSREY